jgi:hypothetical protein
VSADRRPLVRDPLLIPVDRHLAQAAADHCPLTRRNLFGGGDIAAG